MHKFYLTLPAALLLSACASTPIAQIGFPTPTVLKGEVHSIDDDSFILKDSTGQIEVETEGYDDIDKLLKVGEMVTVKGVLDEDDSEGKDHIVAEEFDAYAIIRENGEEIKLIPYDAKHRQK